MSTPVTTIREWYERGVAQKARYMVVWVDTFDYEDYPSFYATKEKAQAAINNPSSMQRVMEVYDLHGNKEQQLQAGTRVWDLKPNDT